MLYGTLGKWDTTTVDLYLNPGYKPFNAIYYLVPNITKDTFFKKLQRLVNIGVLTPVYQLQYRRPIFRIPNEDVNMRFITDDQNLNHKVVRKPYPLPIIGETIQKLEGFQYATALDLNMGYYIIAITTESNNSETIVTEFGKLIYNKVPMGLCAYGEIFQDKVDNILDETKGVNNYIDNRLVLSKGSLSQYIYQIRVLLDRLHVAALKVNAPK